MAALAGSSAARFEGTIDGGVGRWSSGRRGSTGAWDGPPVDGPALDETTALNWPALDGAAVNGPASDEPSKDRPASDGPALDGPATDGPATEERPAVDKEPPAPDGPAATSEDGESSSSTSSFSGSPPGSRALGLSRSTTSSFVSPPIFWRSSLASSPSPSPLPRARATMLLFLRCSATMRSSIVSLTSRRCTCTGFVWPMRCARSMAWASTKGFQYGSWMMTWFAMFRLSPALPCRTGRGG